jgi:hypothetical protein
MMGDDFCLDENAGVAYVATHRQNTIDRVSLQPGENSYERHSVVGKPFTDQLIGPTKGAWGRGPGEYGKIAYFQTDGGTKSLPIAAGGSRPAGGGVASRALGSPVLEDLAGNLRDCRPAG